MRSRPTPLKVHVSADMEGVAGIVDLAQVDPDGGAEYALGRRLMTAEVNAVIEGAFAAGADEVVVCDAHWNKRNLLMESLDPRARVVSGGPRPLGMMAGIDASFAAGIFLGYHASEGHPHGVLAHTWSHLAVDGVRLAGRPAGEGALNAAIAGHFGVPIALTIGDRWANDEIEELLGTVDRADVKEGIGRSAANTLVPARAVELIRERTRAALGALHRFRPLELPAPVEIEVRFKQVDGAERAARSHPGIERRDGKTVGYAGADVLDAFRAFAGMF
ncbi:MAG TPA: M55 family metallopeptidase [Gemmatimonadota bacterium]|nr:M55 family metallopeptidase [Gemmatimonadota bacterium]